MSRQCIQMRLIIGIDLFVQGKIWQEIECSQGLSLENDLYLLTCVFGVRKIYGNGQRYVGWISSQEADRHQRGWPSCQQEFPGGMHASIPLGRKCSGLLPVLIPVLAARLRWHRGKPSRPLSPNPSQYWCELLMICRKWGLFSPFNQLVRSRYSLFGLIFSNFCRWVVTCWLGIRSD